jgi:hypothetical protein
MSIPSEVIALVTNSGNSFHAKVARWFKENDWQVVVSPYYMDQSQSKAREIDLIAEKLFPINDFFGHAKGYIAVRLFIECKFVPTHSVFWFTDKDMRSADNLVCASGVFRSGNSYTEKHHYLSTQSRVAKLFATKADKSTETEPFYKALNQSLNAMVSMRGTQLSNQTVKKSFRLPVHILEFPVIVCNSFDNLFEVDFYGDTQPTALENNFQLEVRYAYVNRNSEQNDEYFLLDVIEYNQLETFTRAIQSDAEVAAYFQDPDA